VTKKKDEKKMAEIVQIHRKRTKATEAQKYALKGIYLRWLYVAMVVLVVLAISLLGEDDASPPLVQGENTVTQSTNTEEENQGAALVDDAPLSEAVLKDVTEEAPGGTVNAVGQEDISSTLKDESKGETIETEVQAVQGVPPALLNPGNAVWSRSYGYGYDVTWQDYRFHSGADMGLEVGSPIFAAAAGQVEKIVQESDWGSRIYINHGGSLVCVYGGLVPLAGLKAGDKVEAGEQIGEITDSPPIESGDPSHLHFEIWMDGENQDPAVWLP